MFVWQIVSILPDVDGIGLVAADCVLILLFDTVKY